MNFHIDCSCSETFQRRLALFSVCQTCPATIRSLDETARDMRIRRSSQKIFNSTFKILQNNAKPHYPRTRCIRFTGYRACEGDSSINRAGRDSFREEWISPRRPSLEFIHLVIRLICDDRISLIEHSVGSDFRFPGSFAISNMVDDLCGLHDNIVHRCLHWHAAKTGFRWIWEIKRTLGSR